MASSEKSARNRTLPPQPDIAAGASWTRDSHSGHDSYRLVTSPLLPTNLTSTDSQGISNDAAGAMDLRVAGTGRCTDLFGRCPAVRLQLLPRPAGIEHLPAATRADRRIDTGRDGRRRPWIAALED